MFGQFLQPQKQKTGLFDVCEAVRVVFHSFVDTSVLPYLLNWIYAKYPKKEPNKRSKIAKDLICGIRHS